MHCQSTTNKNIKKAKIRCFMPKKQVVLINSATFKRKFLQNNDIAFIEPFYLYINYNVYKLLVSKVSINNLIGFAW